MDGNIYDVKIPIMEFNQIQDKATFEEFIRQKILLLLKNETLSVKTLAKKINLDSSEILKHIVSLQGMGLISMEKVENMIPYYVVTMEGH